MASKRGPFMCEHPIIFRISVGNFDEVNLHEASKSAVCQRKRSRGESSWIPSAQGGTEIGKGDERIHELDLQSRYV